MAYKRIIDFPALGAKPLAADLVPLWRTSSGMTVYATFAEFLTTITDFGDFPSSYTSQGGKILRVNTGETAIEFIARTVLGNTDFPASYSGQAGKAVLVNGGETGLEFGTAGSALPQSNIIFVDSAETEETGKIYNTAQAAITWIVANETLSATNRWIIKVNDPVCDEILTGNPYIKIVGNSGRLQFRGRYSVDDSPSVAGGLQVLADFAVLENVLLKDRFQDTGDTTASDPTVTNLDTSNNSYQVGDPIAGPNIPYGAVVQSIDVVSATVGEITMDVNATATASGQTFSIGGRIDIVDDADTTEGALVIRDMFMARTACGFYINTDAQLSIDAENCFFAGGNKAGTVARVAIASTSSGSISFTRVRWFDGHIDDQRTSGALDFIDCDFNNFLSGGNYINSEGATVTFYNPNAAPATVTVDGPGGVVSVGGSFNTLQVDAAAAAKSVTVRSAVRMVTLNMNSNTGSLTVRNSTVDTLSNTGSLASLDIDGNFYQKPANSKFAFTSEDSNDAISELDLRSARIAKNSVYPTTEPTASGSGLAMGDGANAGSNNSIAIGNSAVSNTGGIAIGESAAESNGGIALGKNAASNTAESSAIGEDASVTGNGAMALGKNAKSDIDGMINVGHPFFARGADLTSPSATEAFRRFSAPEVFMVTDEIDLKTTGSITLQVPAQVSFYPTEVGIILSTLGGTITTQPVIRIGVSGDTQKYKTSGITTGLTAVRQREKYAPSNDDDPITNTTLEGAVDTAAAGSAAISGRFYFKGIIVRHEV